MIGKHHVHPYSKAWALKDRQTSTARLFQAYFAAKILVSRFVAKTWPAFRSLWRESGDPKTSRPKRPGTDSEFVCFFALSPARGLRMAFEPNERA
jgi:hypothetical protein